MYLFTLNPPCTSNQIRLLSRTINKMIKMMEPTMKTIIIFSLLLAFSAPAMAEKLPDGHPTIQQAIDASPNTGNKDLANEGTVVSTVQTEHYTYIEVQQGKQKIWLAAQQLALPDGAKIRYGQGVSMDNFYSDTLKREFPRILFVQTVKVVKE